MTSKFPKLKGNHKNFRLGEFVNLVQRPSSIQVKYSDIKVKTSQQMNVRYRVRHRGVAYKLLTL